MPTAPIIPFPALACPLDKSPLENQGASWRCAAGHSFDIASQGYIHLLPVQNKRSRDPGDSKEMIAARRRFREAGVYQPIAQAVAEATLTGLSPASTPGCLDAGCGEGYYLRQLATAAMQGSYYDETRQVDEAGAALDSLLGREAEPMPQQPTAAVGSVPTPKTLPGEIGTGSPMAPVMPRTRQATWTGEGDTAAPATPTRKPASFWGQFTLGNVWESTKKEVVGIKRAYEAVTSAPAAVGNAGVGSRCNGWCGGCCVRRGRCRCNEIGSTLVHRICRETSALN